MDENNKNTEPHKDDKIDGEIRIKVPFEKKLTNFWYYYKWHTIIAIGVLAVLIVVTLSFCRREKYDINILYAGDKNIISRASDGDTPEREKFLNTFEGIVSDFDGNGEVNVDFKSLYCPDAEEIAALESAKKEVPHDHIYKENETLSTLLQSNEYFLLLLDYAVFEKCVKESNMISSVKGYLPSGWENENRQVLTMKDIDGNEVSAVYLKDTKLYERDGIKGLPEDTVICIKHHTAFAKDSEKEKHAQAIEVFKKIVAM